MLGDSRELVAASEDGGESRANGVAGHAERVELIGLPIL